MGKKKVRKRVFTSREFQVFDRGKVHIKET